MRISYVGGGTDYSDYIKDSPGGVIAAAINQYIYVYSNPLSEIAHENFRFTYRESESVSEHIQFQHPVVRELLGHINWTSRLNMGTFADLPSGIGLGGSSAFSVAMAKLLEEKADRSTPKELAELAIHVERNLLLEPGGYQDQYASAFGGIRGYDFRGVNDTEVSGQLLSDSEIAYLEARQLLVWVGRSRDSASHSLVTIDSIKRNRELLEKTYLLYLSTRNAIKMSNGNPEETFASLASAVRNGWELKQEFTSKTDANVSQILGHAVESGVATFKLCGAGGSGFVLLMAEPHHLDRFKQKYSDFKILIPRIDRDGCKTLIDE